MAREQAKQEGHTSVTNVNRISRHTGTAALAIILVIAIADPLTVIAQSGAGQVSPVVAALGTTPGVTITSAAPSAVESNAVRILAGRSTIIDVGVPIARVSLTSADVADAMVTSPNQLLVNGKMPGTISMFVWDRAGVLRRYEVSVGRDLSVLNEQVHQLFPGESIEVHGTGKNVVLSGLVSNKETAEKAANVAAGYVDKKEEVVSLLQIRQAPATDQVLLRVRFAEVNRGALTELGLQLAANGYNNGRWYGRSTTGQFPAPAWDQQGKMVISDFLNLFLFDAKNQLAGVLKAMQNKGVFQTLAEPNLVAESGKDASFLAGGEIPVPVVQGSGVGQSVTILWKEFGIRLSFTPQVNADRIHLKVKPEVSTLDFNNAVVLQGFRVPALSTRRTETELELDNGQTFAISGLLNNSVSSTLQKIPGIGDIPVLGALFKSKSAQKDQTELVVMITPEILRRDSPGVTPNLPRTPERFLDPLPDRNTHELPPPAFGARGGGAAVTPAPAPAVAKAKAKKNTSPAAAAATMSGLTSSGPKIAPAPASAVPTAVSNTPASNAPVPEPANVTPVPATASPDAVRVVPAPGGVGSPSVSEPSAPVSAVSPTVVAQPADEVPTAQQKTLEDFLKQTAPPETSAPAATPDKPKAATSEETRLLERALREQLAREDAMKRAEGNANRANEGR